MIAAIAATREIWDRKLVAPSGRYRFIRRTGRPKQDLSRRTAFMCRRYQMARTAVRICPACRDYLFPSHRSVEPGYMAAMEALGIEPWFKLNMRLGEGSGCFLSFTVMEAACAILSRMATFEKAGIDDSYLKEIRELETSRQGEEIL